MDAQHETKRRRQFYDVYISFQGPLATDIQLQVLNYNNVPEMSMR